MYESFSFPPYAIILQSYTHALKFFTEILVFDFPAEVFLLNPGIVQV
jgi:hypothetical protein